MLLTQMDAPKDIVNTVNTTNRTNPNKMKETTIPTSWLIKLRTKAGLVCIAESDLEKEVATASLLGYIDSIDSLIEDTK